MAAARIDRGESDAVLELCRRRQEDDCEEFYRYELDGEERLTSLFWADADSRMDYCTGLGDVVVFDTTCCRTNRHGVPFVPFLGLSRHRTPVVLGCGVIADQSLGSVVWLLRAFMLSNDQKMPTSVIIDDSDAVAGAIRVVFPGSNHRLCSWPVEQAIEAHLYGSPSAQNEFRFLMCGASSPAEFHYRWPYFLATHGTAANQRWLAAMYDKRELWAAAFVHDKFFLGMANDQRTECLATALHAGLHDGMSLPDLLRHAGACADALRRDVGVLDREADMSQLELTTEHRCLEEHAARLFTPANFYLLREEIKMLGSFEVVKTLPPNTFGDKVHFVRFRQRRCMLFLVEEQGRSQA